MIRLIIADDHSIVREGMKRLIDAQPDLSVIAEAADGHAVLECLRTVDADVLILDLSMPGRNGIDLIKQIKDTWPTLPILILTMHEEHQYALRSIRAGAKGYLTKDAAGVQLVEAIRRLHAGRMFISNEVAELIAMQAVQPDWPASHTTLSNREFEVFNLLVAGRSVSEIGQLLHISVKTVSTHKTHVIEKMRAQSVADLVRYAIEHQLSM
jgi:DNA-binding NarL/FixJ family response regulator